MTQLTFCNDICRALYRRSIKKKKLPSIKRFALMASSQKRCGFCGDLTCLRKRINVV